MSDLIPGAVYYDGTHDGTMFRGIVVEVISTIEAEGRFPVFVIVHDEERKSDQEWISVGIGLECDDGAGSGIAEDRLIDRFECQDGESWEGAIRRKLPELLGDDDFDYDHYSRQERAMQAGMAFGCQGYNDEMGY